MANDTDLLATNDSSMSSTCHNGEVDARQASSVALNTASGSQDTPPPRAAPSGDEKVDSRIANGCVKLLECQDAVEPVVCLHVPPDDAAAKLADAAACADYQRSTANGLLMPTIDKLSDQLIVDSDVHSQQSAVVSPKCAPDCANPTPSEFRSETVSCETAERQEVDVSCAEESSSCVSSFQQTALTSNLSSLSIADEESGSPSVPYDDTVVVATQSDSKQSQITYIVYESERQMEAIMQLITKDLSEPYSIYTYRYFIHNWPKLCFLVGY